jgi:hypothetical protein
VECGVAIGNLRTVWGENFVPIFADKQKYIPDLCRVQGLALAISPAKPRVERLLRLNHNRTVRQWSRCLEHRTGGGEATQKEEEQSYLLKLAEMEKVISDMKKQVE